MTLDDQIAILASLLYLDETVTIGEYGAVISTAELIEGKVTISALRAILERVKPRQKVDTLTDRVAKRMIDIAQAKELWKRLESQLFTRDLKLPDGKTPFIRAVANRSTGGFQEVKRKYL